MQAYKRNPAAAPCVETLQVYNSLLRGFSRQRDFDQLEKLWQEMSEAGVSPSLSSYISYLLSFHAATINSVNSETFREIFDEFTRAGHTVDEAMILGDFLLSDKKYFIDAVSRFTNIDPLVINSNLHIQVTTDQSFY